MKRGAIQCRPTAQFCFKQLIPHRIEDHRGHNRAIFIGLQSGWAMLKPERNAKLWKPVRKICCSIQRIDIPAKLPVQSLPCSLFSVDSVQREGLGQARADRSVLSTVRCSATVTRSTSPLYSVATPHLDKKLA